MYVLHCILNNLMGAKTDRESGSERIFIEDHFWNKNKITGFFRNCISFTVQSLSIQMDDQTDITRIETDRLVNKIF